MGAHWTPATQQEIGVQVMRILGSMPAPRGSDADQLSSGYFDGLRSFPARAISDAVDGFLSGRFGERKWLPTPPELSTMVRACLGSATGAEGKRYYRMKQPKSPILKQEITRDWAKQLVGQGVYPRGSIWIPGNCIGEEAKPWIGDLFAPDDQWESAMPLQTAEEAR